MKPTEDTPTPDPRQAVIDRLNANRKPWQHDFAIFGKCRNCSTRITDLPVGRPLTAQELMCKVITPEEVARFRDYDAR